MGTAILQFPFSHFLEYLVKNVRYICNATGDDVPTLFNEVKSTNICHTVEVSALENFRAAKMYLQAREIVKKTCSK